MQLSTRVHGILDYLTGALLLASPWLFRFANHHVETSIAVAAGAVLLFMSVITDYEMALLRFVPFRIHRAADLLLGIMLGFAPIHFSTAPVPGTVFVIVGLMEIGAALLTRSAKPGGHPIVPGA